MTQPASRQGDDVQALPTSIEELFSSQVTSNRRQDVKDELELYLSLPSVQLDPVKSSPLHWWKVR